LSFASAYKITEKKLGKTEDAIHKTIVPSEKKHFYADSRLNYSFSQLQVNAGSPTNVNETKEVCPLKCMSPLSCPFGGACQICPTRVQTKAKISQPEDGYEQEADRVAEMVMRMAEPGVPSIQPIRTSKNGKMVQRQQQTVPQQTTSNVGPAQVTIHIDRETETANSTQSTLTVGTANLQTLELPDRNNAATNNSDTAGRIPAGNYNAHVRTDGPLGWRIELENVPGRANIQIHVGNTPADSTGCILPGTTRGQDRVNNSINARDQIANEVQNAGQGATIQVIITDPPTVTPPGQTTIPGQTTTTPQTTVQPKYAERVTEPTQTNIAETVHTAVQNGGQAMPESTRNFFERRFGQDFSQVRVHSDAEAATSAMKINALAYTYGNDIFMGAGQYSPYTATGQRLLAHELTHVVQNQ
jgi:hypothetical protein